MGCSDALIKVIMVITNLIFLIASLVMLAFGITLVAAPGKILSFLESTGLDLSVISEATGGYFMNVIHYIGIFMIVLGAIVVLLSFFGFAGACCENSCLLGVYSVILIVIVLAELALIIFAAAYPSQFRKAGGDALYDTLSKGFKSDIKVSNQTKFENSTDPVSLAWAAMQFKVECCGAKNYTDYKVFTWERCGLPCPRSSVVPMSCCKLKEKLKFPSSEQDFVNFRTCVDSADPVSTNLDGCAGKVIDDATTSINQYSSIAIGIAAGIIGLEVILIIFSFCLCCRSKRGGRNV